jgi:hypothetical protein
VQYGVTKKTAGLRSAISLDRQDGYRTIIPSITETGRKQGDIMGFLSITRLIAKLFGKPSDLVAFIISIGIAFFTASYLPKGPWATYTFLLVAYHLFLVWIVVDSSYESGLSLPIVSTILTHLSYLAISVAIGLAAVYIQSFTLLRILVLIVAVVVLARSECDSLFKARSKNKTNKKVSASKAEAAQKAAAVENAVAAAATVDDYEEWLKYLAQPNRPPRKPGLSVQDEYKQWLVARARSRMAPHPKP